MTLSGANIYYRKADAEAGGPAGKLMDDIAEGRATFTRNEHPAEVLEVDGKLVKVKVLGGDKAGTTGWVEREKLHGPVN